MSMMNISEDDQRGLHQVLARAATDVAFRQQLVANPHAAIENETGRQLSKEFRIRFIEKDPELDALVVLPDVVGQQAELTEEELEAIAGGAMQHEEAIICWDTCESTCTQTCIVTGISKN